MAQNYTKTIGHQIILLGVLIRSTPSPNNVKIQLERLEKMYYYCASHIKILEAAKSLNSALIKHKLMFSDQNIYILMGCIQFIIDSQPSDY